jgi:hypothetical protein
MLNQPIYNYNYNYNPNINTNKDSLLNTSSEINSILDTSIETESILDTNGETELIKLNIQNEIENECSICFELLNNNTNLILFECHHKYHEICIKKWLNNSVSYNYPQCPECSIKSFLIIEKNINCNPHHSRQPPHSRQPSHSRQFNKSKLKRSNKSCIIQ